MSAGKMVFDADEARRLQTKISQVSEDTNRLYLQLKGQASQWDGLPIGTGRLQAQVLINELTVEAEKLEDLIRIAVKGVQDVQDESKRQAGQLSQQFGIFGGMFGSFGAGFGSAGRLPIPAFAQKISTHLISSIAILSGKDELNSDPMVRKLLDMNSQSGLGTVDSIAVQSKLKDIYEARDQIAKAQTAFGVYQAFGNQAQMDRVHQLAEEARAKLKSFGVDEVQYQAGKDLSVYFKQPAVKACKYDPSITSGNVPLVQNEAYLLLLRMGMEDGVQGKWAKGQLEGIHATMKQMIATGVNLGVHMMTNQGAEAWGDVARLTSSFAQLESYNLFKSKAPDEQPEAPEKSKNAFLKSLDSFKEIGTGFMDTLRIRADKATDSPYDFVNWITLGIAGDLPVGIYRQAKERADHMLDSPEKFADWLTLGTVEMGKGAFHPEESWSAEHWLNSLGVVSLLVGPLEKSLLSTGGELPKLRISKDLADNGMDIIIKEKGGQGIGGMGNVADEVRPINPKTGEIIYHDWIPARPIDLETEQYLIDKVVEARSGLSNKYKDKGNFAYVKAEIEGLDQSEFFAHSKISDLNKKLPGTEKFSLDPESPSFPATKAALDEGNGDIILRDMDTEYKILNDIDKKLGDNREAKGTIIMFTEKDTCGSCNLVISKFKEKYPDITIEIIHNNGKLIET